MPRHPGSLTLDQRNWKITELSAKTHGNEFGIRAEDGDTEFLGFLFLAPDGSSAQACQDSVLKTDGLDRSAAVTDRTVIASSSGVEIATALIHFEKRAKLRAFVASGDLCGDLVFDFPLLSAEQQKAAIENFKNDLRTLTFDPAAKPTFPGAFAYATVAFAHRDKVGAVRGYEAALDLVKSIPDKDKWRRLTWHQLFLALDISKNPRKLRSECLSAIKDAPERPGCYFLLARADAEEGNSEAARTHLQQAFDRRNNHLPGEIFPELSADESLLKLKANRDFWDFVEVLSAQLKKS